jgi:tetratricopeptide (TPR) repeat protein
MTLRPGRTLCHYRLVDKIGEGGMGVVWRAVDTELNREVALKFLPDSLANQEDLMARFRREAKALAALNHPNIVTIHTVEEADGVRFLAMELIEGRTLAGYIPEGGMPIDRLTELAVSMADALGTAHRSGITHRDLKPANVMVTNEGRLKILDFGLAKVRRERGSLEPLHSATGLTHEGDLVGTIQYMAPEQLDGKPADERSDIFSFGAILYEMATGLRPFHGSGMASLVSAILKEEPPPVTELRGDLPADLDRIVHRCLDKDPAKRYATAESLREELEALAVDLSAGRVRRVGPFDRGQPARWTAAAAVVAAALFGGWMLRDPTGGSPADVLGVLVLPFEVRGQDEAGEFLGLSVAEAVAVDLAPALNLKVLPVQPEDPGGDPLAAGRRSEARYVVSGAVLPSGADVALSAQVVDVREQRLVSGAEASGPVARLSLLAADLSDEIGEMIDARFARTYGMPREIHDPELRVSEELADFRYAYADGNLQGILETATRLVAAFPDKPEAHATRLYASILQASDEPSTEVVLDLERGIASLAQLDPRSPYLDLARTSQADIRGRPQDSLRLFETILERNDLTPGFRAWMLRGRSHRLVRIGEYERALVDAEEALDLDPANPWAFSKLSHALERLGRSEEALDMARRCVRLRPSLAYPHMLVGSLLLDLQRYDEAVEALDVAQTSKGTWQSTPALRALALRYAGRTAEAEADVRKAVTMPDSPDGMLVLARERALAGRHDEALEFLRRARRAGFADPIGGTVRELRALHGDPEFEAIREEVEAVVRDARG